MITVVASGGFDPLHVGHIEYLEKAKALGDKLIVILNSDRFLIQKKGKVFMPYAERQKILEALRCVDEVIPCIDADQSVSLTLSIIRPHIFAKGGDRNASNIPEKEICDRFGIKIVDGLGEKVQSSSALIEKIKE